MKRLPLILLLMLVLLPPAVHAQSQRSLTVMLYPYIPDVNNDGFAALTQYVKQGFEALHPDIDLTIIMDQKQDTYDVDTLSALYTQPDGPQVIELDLMMLSSITNAGWVKPISYSSQDAFPVALNAIQHDGHVWAIPTRLCSLFLFGSDPEIATATSSDDLVAILNSLDPDNQLPNLVGGFFGQNTLSIYYADSYIGDNGFDGISTAFDLPPSEPVVSEMSRLFEECTFQGQNNCLSELYEDNSKPSILFAQGQALSTIGFSESLYYILTHNSVGNVYITPAPLGGSTIPMIYSDGFTLNAQNCDTQCEEDAYSFANYYLSSDVQLWITMGADGTTGVPRYVLPAQPSFYELPQVSSDPYFDEFLPTMMYDSVAFPTDGYVEARDALFTDVCQELDSMMPGDPCPVPS